MTLATITVGELDCDLTLADFSRLVDIVASANEPPGADVQVQRIETTLDTVLIAAENQAANSAS